MFFGVNISNFGLFTKKFVFFLWKMLTSVLRVVDMKLKIATLS